MSQSILEKKTVNELRKIGKKLGITNLSTFRKQELINEIENIRRDKKFSKQNKKYTRLSQIGQSGKEGTTFGVVDKKGNVYAMKTFRNSKSENIIMREASFQQRAAEIGVSPVIIDINPVKKYIVMEKMDETLFDIIKKNKGVIPITYQKQIFTIFNKLDRIGILHGDPNSTNFMIKGRKLYIIDYGFAKEIDKKLINKYKLAS